MKFRYYKPKDKIKRFSEYFDLLDDLFHFQQGYTEEEFLFRIESSKVGFGAGKEHVFQTLRRYGMIIETDNMIPTFVLSLPYRNFLEYLYQDSQPVNSLIIQGYISTLDQCLESLRKAYENNTKSLTHRHLVRLGHELDNISLTSSRNRLGIISEVRKLKINEDKLSYKERLSESNRLWDEYLEPLRQMIAPTGSFGELMDRLKQTLDQGDAKFNSYTELRLQFSLNRSKRIKLNEQTRHDLSEAQRELEPLREKLVQESRLLEASSIIFEKLEQGKLNKLPTLKLKRLLKHERQIGLSGMRGYLADLWCIKAEPESILFDEPEIIASAPLEKEEIIQLLKTIPEDTNIVDYFMQHYETLSASEIFRAISIASLHQQEYPILENEKDQEYIIQGQKWRGSSFTKVRKND